MKNVILVIVMLIQVNAFAMGQKPAEPTPVVPPPPPKPPGFSEEEKNAFISNNDFYEIRERIWARSNCAYYPRLKMFFSESSNENIYDCNAAEDSSLYSPTLIGYKFKAMSQNGKNYVLDMEIRNPLFQSLLSTREDSVILRYEGRLASCNNEPISATTPASDMEGMIAGLQGIRFSDFFVCKIEMKFKVASSEIVQRDTVLSSGGRSGLVLNIAPKLNVNIYKNGSADFNFQLASGYGVDRFYKYLGQASSRTKNPEARAAAFLAAKEFVAQIKAHGLEIARSAMLKNISEHERQAILMQSLMQKKSLILAALKGVNDNFSSLETVDKFSVATAIGAAYEQVKRLERTVGLTPDYTLMLDLNPFELQQ